MVRSSTVSDYTKLNKSYVEVLAVCSYDPYVTLTLIHLGSFNSLVKYGIADFRNLSVLPHAGLYSGFSVLVILTSWFLTNHLWCIGC